MNTHTLNLRPRPFLQIKEGTKRIEMRLFDEKRSKIKVGDNIIFLNNATAERISATVIGLKRFKTFKELYASYDPLDLGYKEDEEVSYLDMNIYYEVAMINKWGVLAIRFKLN